MGLAGICRTSAVALIYFTLKEDLQERSTRLQPPILQFSQNGKPALSSFFPISVFGLTISRMAYRCEGQMSQRMDGRLWKTL